ncbi:MAG: polysaccharide pyruvyl transferase family protein [Draconibacterium sp.]
MKTGLLTFHCAQSYGAVLQAFALKRYLQSLGHEVTFINYRPDSLVRKKISPGNIINYFLFRRFEKKWLVPQTKAFKAKSEIDDSILRFDAYIVGSDQVWNLDFSENSELTYFFDFIPDHKLKISYAASFGKSELEIPKDKKVEIQLQLQEFKAISIREKSGLSILDSIFKLQGEQSIDPTFLLKEDNYREYFEIKEQQIKKQMLCFKFLKDGYFFETVQQIKRIYGIQILVVGKPQLVKGIRFVSYPSPSRWLKLFYQSEYVFTDSFHGLAFAIIFKKKFIVTPANVKRFTRIKDLLDVLGLGNRIYYQYENILKSNAWLQDIDYSIVEKKLNALREKSTSFLNNNLL